MREYYWSFYEGIKSQKTLQGSLTAQIKVVERLVFSGQLWLFALHVLSRSDPSYFLAWSTKNNFGCRLVFLGLSTFKLSDFGFKEKQSLRVKNIRGFSNLTDM